jgi:poly(3-hydroxybutyrate) depolymerase
MGRGDIVVLYPQAAPVIRRLIGMPLKWPNPQGCWDWWGFTGKDFAYRTGAQIGAITAMIDRLAAKGGASGSPKGGSICH